MSMILDGSNGVTFNDSSLQGAAASPYVLKNRIINGDMRIDQRNAGAAQSPITSGNFVVDRFKAEFSQSGKLNAQQNAGSVTPPTGFTNYAGLTSTSAYTVGASDYFLFEQFIEGYNTADLAWGTANAKTVTLSFWVRSSLTGTFGGVFSNASGDRIYGFSYTISSANTWEQKTITVTGDTTGTWNTTNSSGIQIRWGLGIGSSYSISAGSWGSSGLGVTGATSVVGTNGATFYITGVQLEVGSTATPFERRLYGTELALCQRYYENNYGVGYAVGSSIAYPTNFGSHIQGYTTSLGQKSVMQEFKTTKRAVPTITFYSQSGVVGQLTTLDPGGTPTSKNVGYSYCDANTVQAGVGADAAAGIGVFWTASAEL